MTWKNEYMRQRIMILSGQSNLNSDIYEGQVAVFIHLHYRDTLNKYFSYMTYIPESIPIYVSSNDKWIEDNVRKYSTDQKRKITVFHKKNRGRDITALLVIFRQIMLQYEYVCFLHDKKEKREEDKEDTSLWVDNLWGNLLGRGGIGYFLEVLEAFEKDKSLGLLVPPEPIGDIFSPHNAWNETNVSQTRRLAEELGIHVNINSDIEKQPISLGTCFWARTCAIRKLLTNKWTYEDFDDEPLPDDAKSYAVERIFGYLTEDEGYYAYIVMDRIYATIYMSFLIEYRRNAFRIIENRYGVCAFLGVNCLKKILEYASIHKTIYIYGAGKIGIGIYQYLIDMGYSPRNFLVSRKEQDYSQMPIPVLDIDQLLYEEDMGIIIAVGKQTIPKIVDILENRGIKNYFRTK